MNTGIFAAITLVLLAATLLPLLRSRAWWIRALDFPRLQLLLVSAGVLLAQCFLHRIDDAVEVGVISANAACMLYQAWWILPYTRLHPVEVRDCGDPARPRLRLLATNVLMTNREADRLLALVRAERPDVLIAVETDAWWEARLDTLSDLLPHALRRPLDNLYGMHLYSRLPLRDAEVKFIVEDDIPSMHARIELDGGASVALHCLHPRPPSPTEADGSGERDAELVAVGRAASDSALPAIVAGDLNDVAWSRTTRLFRKVSGLLDPRIGRGMFNTFHAQLPGLRWPLDHLFHSRDFSLVALRRLPAIGSDHFPILVELALEPGRNPARAGLDEDAQARRDAREARKAAGGRTAGTGTIRRDRKHQEASP
ncbi:endonuclease/exonuclease/phosphatase family protein [Luteimonas sp. Y-2-2-4F]|nr:endonuclease/exonuclease/phosphatase family protein [Luteimonas sp. Y-2-2-4F]MCD9031123.1 endonuclease/exonuclease/phosphatase family protein [Luteimonas sp. Y-2-2-4F]